MANLGDTAQFVIELSRRRLTGFALLRLPVVRLVLKDNLSAAFRDVVNLIGKSL